MGEITSEFNANYDVNHKTCTQLKFLQKNMKSSIKFAVATDRKEKAKTRGGSQVYTELDSFQPAILQCFYSEFRALAMDLMILVYMAT